MRTVLKLTTLIIPLGILLLISCDKENDTDSNTNSSDTVLLQASAMSWANQSGMSMIQWDTRNEFRTDASWHLDHAMEVIIVENGTSVQRKLPYVLYENMNSDNTSLFYTILPITSGLQSIITGPLQIYGRNTATIDFSKTVSVKISYSR